MRYSVVLCRLWNENCIIMRSVAGVFLHEWADADFYAILSVKNAYLSYVCCVWHSPILYSIERHAKELFLLLVGKHGKPYGLQFGVGMQNFG